MQLTQAHCIMVVVLEFQMVVHVSDALSTTSHIYVTFDGMFGILNNSFGAMVFGLVQMLLV